MEMPTEIKDYMELKFQGIASFQDKKRLQSLVSNFFHKMVQNSIPIVKGYVDDIQLVSSSTNKQEVDPTFGNELHFSTQTNKNATTEEIKTEMVVYQQKKKVTEEQMEQFFQNMFFFHQVQVPQDNYNTRREFHQMLDKFSEGCSIGEQSDGFDLPNLYPDYESRLLHPKDMTSTIYSNDTSVQFSEFLKQIKEELSFEIKNQRISYTTLEQDCKFSLENFEFYLPSGEQPFQGNDEKLNEFLNTKNEDCRPVNIFSNNNQRSNVTPKRNLQSIGQREARDDKYVFSLNERLLGKRIPPITDENKGNFPCFNLFQEDNANMSGHTYSSPGSKLKAIDPLLHMVLDQCGQEILGGQSSIKVKTPFIPSSKMNMQHVLPPQQVIFATGNEHEFYTKLTSSKTESSPRIFEIKRVWVDQRTLALSMNPGGWTHPCVMDCYGMLTTTEQLHRKKEGKIGDNEILMHVVIKEVTKLLMDPNLDCSDPEYKRIFSLDYVGYRLENAGLVHIPCPIGKEWILIVANFIDKSFDVLNPDSGVGKFSAVVNTVIFNFKQLFVKCYHGCFKFNIHDFSVKYVHVPKQNFRYDSGIFVIQYMRCYNGVEVKQFSNVDLQAIREKVSCQLVINKFNEQQVPIAREFISKHAPHLLH
ncbi:hypothetical protein ACQ4PT_039046 [Festuca glaucescens]